MDVNFDIFSPPCLWKSLIVYSVFFLFLVVVIRGHLTLSVALRAQMFVPAQCWVAPVTRWFPGCRNLSSLYIVQVAEDLTPPPPFPWIFEKDGTTCVAALCPWRRVTKPGMHREEVTEARLSALSPFLYFPPLLSPTPSLPDKGEKGWWSKRNKPGPPDGGRGSAHVSAHVCVHVRCGRVKRFRGGGLPSRAVSHHAIDPPGSFRCPSGFIILLSG